MTNIQPSTEQSPEWEQLKPAPSTGAPVADFATDWDHLDPQWTANAYEIWADLRERCPVAHTDRYGGAWFLTKYDACVEAAKDAEHLSNRQVVINSQKYVPTPPELENLGLLPPVTTDPPFHAEARRILLSPFSPRSVAKLEPQIRELICGLLDKLGDRTEFDAGSEFYQYIAPSVVALLLGFPPEESDRYLHYVAFPVATTQMDPALRQKLYDEMYAYFMTQIDDHLANPREDMTTFLLDLEVDGEKLSPGRLIGTIMLLLIAGIGTTWSSLGTIFWHLAQHPEHVERLRNEPELMPVALEEFLRYYGPANMSRLATEDFELEGCPVKKDDWVMLGFASANRDADAFENPDEFIIDRQQNRHLTFGLGIHRCLGAHLARLEVKIAIEEFIKRYPRFELADPDAVTWSLGPVRGVRQLPLRIIK